MDASKNWEVVGNTKMSGFSNQSDQVSLYLSWEALGGFWRPFWTVRK